jgi:hypothetical protein
MEKSFAIILFESNLQCAACREWNQMLTVLRYNFFIAPRTQCLKCRTPVNAIATPSRLAASITSASRTDPPG